LLKVKQVMENHIWAKDASLQWHGPPCFYKDNLYEGPSKWNHSPSRNERLRKNHEGLTHEHLVYPKDL
jgi:hypothetical protein